MSRIRFEDTTPINRVNLDKLNNVVISPTEPTTGEEVWIQKGKNLFDINSYVILQGVIALDISRLVIGKTYTFSTNISVKSFKISSFATNHNSVYKDDENGFTTFTFTMTRHPNILEGTKQYLFLATTAMWEWVSDISQLNGYNIQIEQGETATEYEEFVVKKIHTKNDNGVYEEFYDETNLENYSTSEQKIGTWTDGKPIYRKVITYTITTTNDARYAVQNLDKVIDIRGIATNGSNSLALNHYLNDGTDHFISAWIAGSKIYTLCSSAYDGYVCTLILEYTKTID